MVLKVFKTRELVEELKKREGVEVVLINPYKKEKLEIEGPATLLKIID